MRRLHALVTSSTLVRHVTQRGSAPLKNVPYSGDVADLQSCSDGLREYQESLRRRSASSRSRHRRGVQRRPCSLGASRIEAGTSPSPDASTRRRAAPWRRPGASSLVVMVLMKRGSSFAASADPSSVPRRAVPARAPRQTDGPPRSHRRQDRQACRTAATGCRHTSMKLTPRTSRRSSRVKLGRSLGNSASRAPRHGVPGQTVSVDMKSSQLAPPPRGGRMPVRLRVCLRALGGRSCRTPRVSRGSPSCRLPAPWRHRRPRASRGRAGSVHDERSSPQIGLLRTCFAWAPHLHRSLPRRRRLRRPRPWTAPNPRVGSSPRVGRSSRDACALERERARRCNQNTRV